MLEPPFSLTYPHSHIHAGSAYRQTCIYSISKCFFCITIVTSHEKPLSINACQPLRINRYKRSHRVVNQIIVVELRLLRRTSWHGRPLVQRAVTRCQHGRAVSACSAYVRCQHDRHRCDSVCHWMRFSLPRIGILLLLVVVAFNPL